MNIVFWNIARGLTAKKTEWLEKLIVHKSPDTFCIAEGPESLADTQELAIGIERNGYKCYYSPVFYQEPVIARQYGWNRFGLKVFIRDGVKLKTKFAFLNQKKEGRIIYLRFRKDGKDYSTFLIHGTSKLQTPMRQNGFIIELANFIRPKTLNKDDGVIIMGDFNLEPWDDSLQDEDYIKSYSSLKSFNYFSFRKKPGEKIYKSPILNYIETHTNADLIGTFYKGGRISILDFPLLSGDITNFELEVLTEINSQDILIQNNNKHVLADGLDHLPVLLKII